MTQEPAGSVVDQILSALGMNAAYVVQVYSLYQNNPESVASAWRGYFRGLERGETSAQDYPRTEESEANRGSGVGTTDNGAAGINEPSPVLGEGDILEPLRGGNAIIVRNMDASRAVPTATSYRDIPVKVLEENRRFLNHFLALNVWGKVSFTHIIAWALARALKTFPAINYSFAEVDGEPHRLRRAHLNLGLAIDLERKDGSRNLLVPNIPAVESLDFSTFLAAYNELVDKARTGKLEPAAFQGTTLTLTNPGTVGTGASVPRLMSGQGAIVAVGSIGYSAETRAMSQEMLSTLGISKQMTISCTYDHRVIQGAASGLFLAEVERLLQGEDEFYDQIYRDMGVPYHPVRWTTDVGPAAMGGGRDHEEIAREARVLQLINAYRVRGHLIANLDPLGSKAQYHPELDIAYYGLTLWDLDRSFITGGHSAWDTPQSTLRDILQTLRAAYGAKIGIEYMNIQDPQQKLWIQERVEPDSARAPLAPDVKKRVLDKLIRSETLEQFLQTKYLGHKRFSLEGGETLIPLLDELLEEAADAGVGEVVLGMAHRGRLNVVTQTIKVDPARIFAEFQGTRDLDTTQGSGDVKYHLAATGVHHASNGAPIKISVAPNPSHLEAVDPIVEGVTRAKQERMGADEGRKRILPVLIHGDAAFAGQGVVAETLNLSQLKGYRTGGTVHIIVNNQIGFTTMSESARSSPYPTDVAKMCQAPIFHVNGDDPEAAVRVLRWAFAFRQAFEKDVVIDMFCYRRHGHNEGDEPSYTQPQLYQKIRNHESVPVQFGKRLVREEVLTVEEVAEMRAAAKAELDQAFDQGAKGRPLKPAPIERSRPMEGAAPVPRPTAVSRDALARITEGLLHVPPEVELHPKLGKFFAGRRKAMESGEGIDWAFAESLAFGSLVLEGAPVRLSGQDSVRGTFSQRHLLLRDDDTDVSWMPLQHLSPNQAPFLAVDSPLSEEAVLGFEYGYSIGDPTALVLWEAQFGDFVNEAQVVIDQFIAGSMAKWGQPSGVVLLLPHGYEGQGPDHSTARLERFLQLAAEDNIEVANCTTPAQYFHLLRRQMCMGIRKPLIVMTPKSLLRHPAAVSTVADLADGRFEPVLADPATLDPTRVRRLILCSGKIYYDLAAARDVDPRGDVAIYRVEEMYPFPETQLRQALSLYQGAEVVWAQEEPRNMGAWMYMSDRLRQLPGQTVALRYVGRPESASTATGYLQTHLEDQKRIVREALTL